MRRTIQGLLFALALAASAPAAAQDEASRAVARKLGYEGVEAYQQGDYKAAAEKLGRAYKILKAPSLGLWSARAFEKNGQLVQASERYLEVRRLPTAAGDEAVQEKAKADAAQEYDALQPRIPQLKIEVEGANPDDLEIQIDGVAISSAMIGVPRPANPGNRKVEGKLGTEVVAAWVNLKEGDEKSVSLRFGGLGAVISKEKSGEEKQREAAAASTADPGPPGADQGVAESSMQPLLGYVALGVGGVGLIAGSGAGLVALGKKSDLEEKCPGGDCGPDMHDELDSYNSMRTISTIGFIAGGVGVAAGVALLLTAPDSSAAEQSPTSAWVRPWIGIGSAGVVGAF